MIEAGVNKAIKRQLRVQILQEIVDSLKSRFFKNSKDVNSRIDKVKEQLQIKFGQKLEEKFKKISQTISKNQTISKRIQLSMNQIIKRCQNNQKSILTTQKSLSSIIKEVKTPGQQISAQFQGQGFLKERLSIMSQDILKLKGQIKNLKFQKVEYIKKQDINMKVFQKSNIIEKKEEQNIILNFFKSHKVKSAELMYCASSNAFDKNKFYQTCKDIPNILIITQTQFQKKIGTYSRLGLQSDKQSDKYNRFTFSLTMNNKVAIEKSKQLSQSQKKLSKIQQFELLSPINIVDKSDKFFSSAKVNPSIYNVKYTIKDQLFNMDFVGSKSGQFRANQWEAWTLHFAQQQTQK